MEIFRISAALAQKTDCITTSTGVVFKKNKELKIVNSDQEVKSFSGKFWNVLRGKVFYNHVAIADIS